MKEEKKNKPFLTSVKVITIIALLLLLIGIGLTSLVLTKSSIPGPEGLNGDLGATGLQGEVGPQGDVGLQGIQGIQGEPGASSFIQILQRSNVTVIETDELSQANWHNMSDFDPSMDIIIDISQNSKILVEFTGIHFMETPSSIWVRVVVDNVLVSTRYMLSVGTPASVSTYNCGHLEFLTDSLVAGEHIIQVQFLKDAGNPTIVDRVLTAIEISTD